VGLPTEARCSAKVGLPTVAFRFAEVGLPTEARCSAKVGLPTVAFRFAEVGSIRKNPWRKSKKNE